MIALDTMTLNGIRRWLDELLSNPKNTPQNILATLDHYRYDPQPLLQSGYLLKGESSGWATIDRAVLGAATKASFKSTEGQRPTAVLLTHLWRITPPKYSLKAPPLVLLSPELIKAFHASSPTARKQLGPIDELLATITADPVWYKRLVAASGFVQLLRPTQCQRPRTPAQKAVLDYGKTAWALNNTEAFLRLLQQSPSKAHQKLATQLQVAKERLGTEAHHRMKARLAYFKLEEVQNERPD